jgi:Fe-S oxidoreductase
LLWTDTFNNYFFPDTTRAALTVLRAAGFEVDITKRQFCCGRPLYDFGMLDRAKRYLSRILTQLETEIRNGTPIVVLEPSCAAVFRDELLNLFPQSEDAKRLAKQTFVLSQFLAERAPEFPLPHIGGRAVIHGHCHQKALLKMDSTEAALKKMGIDAVQPESGCCGLAGSFGFEKGEPYEVSMACGERALFPAVRACAPEDLVIADGFSCREQILHGSGRQALHLAEVIERGLKAGQGNPTTGGEAR